MPAYLNAIGTAVPGHDVHPAFLAWARRQIDDPREAKLFDRMAQRSGISHRWSVLPAEMSPTTAGGFYHGASPSTAARMAIYAQAAPLLALDAVAALRAQIDLGEISHLVLASCTGFTAPGVDQIVARTLGLSPGVERLLIGYMGCYAAVAALRSARHIVRSDPQARVLVICVELCSLHLQASRNLESILAMLQFGDGASAALVSGAPQGFEIGTAFATTLPDSQALIQWNVGDTGFEMILSGQVPGAITQALAEPGIRSTLFGNSPADIEGWAVHAGGRSVLDAVAAGLSLEPHALDDSRAILDTYGNMSSATLMFVLARMLARDTRPSQGVALAFGPGVAAEGFHFTAP